MIVSPQTTPPPGSVPHPMIHNLSEPQGARWWLLMGGMPSRERVLLTWLVNPVHAFGMHQLGKQPTKAADAGLGTETVLVGSSYQRHCQLRPFVPPAQHNMLQTPMLKYDVKAWLSLNPENTNKSFCTAAEIKQTSVVNDNAHVGFLRWQILKGSNSFLRLGSIATAIWIFAIWHILPFCYAQRGCTSRPSSWPSVSVHMGVQVWCFRKKCWSVDPQPHPKQETATITGKPSSIFVTGRLAQFKGSFFFFLHAMHWSKWVTFRRRFDQPQKMTDILQQIVLNSRCALVSASEVTINVDTGRPTFQSVTHRLQGQINNRPKSRIIM